MNMVKKTVRKYGQKQALLAKAEELDFPCDEFLISKPIHPLLEAYVVGQIICTNN
jgi:hypothetical protein